MRTRGPLAAAVVTLALLSGCASFADDLREAADVGAAAATTDGTGTSGRSSGASSTTSAPATSTTEAPASGTATTGGAAGTSQPAGTTTTRPAPPPAPGAPAPPDEPAGGWPPETTLTAYREAWGVYLSVAKDYSDAEAARMQQTYRDLQALGYRGYYGTLCDAGAEDAGVGESDDAVAVYFTGEAQAKEFIDGWNRPVVGYARVATFCMQ